MADIVLVVRWLTRIAELVSSGFKNNQDKYSDKNACVHTHKPPPINMYTDLTHIYMKKLKTGYSGTCLQPQHCGSQFDYLVSVA